MQHYFMNQRLMELIKAKKTVFSFHWVDFLWIGLIAARFYIFRIS